MKRVLKILALILALVMLGTVLYFYNALNGNPVSAYLADRAVDRYLEEMKTNYELPDLYVERSGYNFKFANYYARIASRSSMDTQFMVYVNMWGRLEWDTYDDVLSGAVTRSRLEEEYRALTDKVFDSPAFPYPADIGYGSLEIHNRELFDQPQIQDIPDWAIVQEDLVLDQVYDIRELGETAGHLIVYVDSEDVSIENAARILLDIREEFDEADIPFRAIDFTLQHPLPEEGPRDDVFVGVSYFPYEDIYEENLESRIQLADEALKAYYAQLDK